MLPHERITIGRSVEAIFPELGLSVVPAKIDTGAYGSVIHAQHTKIIEREGRKVLRCTLLNHPTSPETHHAMEFETFDKVIVTSSLGHSEERYRIKLKVLIKGIEFETEFTLSNRSHGIYPVLLGRRALRTRFVVDVCKKGYSYHKLIELTKHNSHWVTAQQLKEEL